MNKEKLLKMLKAKEEKRSAMATKAKSTEDIKELRSLNDDMAALNAEIAELRGMIDEIGAEERAAGQGSADPEVTPEEIEQRKAGQTMVMAGGGADVEARKVLEKTLETRGADLKAHKAIVVGFNESTEERAVTIASDTLVTQTKYSNTLSPKFNEVSGLIDKVAAVPLNGGEAYRKGFEVSDGTGDYTAETGAYTTEDPTFCYVDIGKAKSTAYSEITDEAQKLPNIMYQAMVSNAVRKAIRKKITAQILTGDGATNHLTGILNAPVAVIPAATDIEISAIDADTLDTIVFGYGGDENVEGDATLVLNKQTLAAFNAIRATDGKKLYKITLDATGNAGTISSDQSFSVPFVLNSALPSFADAVADTDYFAVYGKLAAYEMPVFSPLTIEESKDFKFGTGQIAYRGSVWCGGNVVAYKGFVRIKKVTAV